MFDAIADAGIGLMTADVDDKSDEHPFTETVTLYVPALLIVELIIEGF
ncbi:MAG: hypothetical protein NVS3B19_10130 [Ginsengibacter sp.]